MSFIQIAMIVGGFLLCGLGIGVSWFIAIRLFMFWEKWRNERRAKANEPNGHA